MLIFGTSVKQFLLASLVLVCETCGNTAPHQVIRRVRRFSLFFVPLFPLSVRFLDSCLACGRQLEVTEQQAQLAVQQAGVDLR